MNRVLPLLFLILAGCAGVQSYTPLVVDVTDQAALDRDTLSCRKVALAWSAPFDLGGIGSAGVEGVAKNAAGAALNIWTPVLGGLGGAGSEALQDLGLSNDAQIRIFLHCLDHKGQQSHSYNVIDPNL
jgi:hypothetical protein